MKKQVHFFACQGDKYSYNIGLWKQGEHYFGTRRLRIGWTATLAILRGRWKQLKREPNSQDYWRLTGAQAFINPNAQNTAAQSWKLGIKWNWIKSDSNRALMGGSNCNGCGARRYWHEQSLRDNLGLCRWITEVAWDWSQAIVSWRDICISWHRSRERDVKNIRKLIFVYHRHLRSKRNIALEREGTELGSFGPKATFSISRHQ